MGSLLDGAQIFMQRITLMLAIVMLAAPASAASVDSTKPTLDVQLFYPSPGATGFFTTESGEVNAPKGLSTGLMLNYARNPLSVKIIKADESQQDVGAVVKNRLDIDLMAAYGILDWLDVGFVLPFITQGGIDNDKFNDVGVDVGVSSLTGFTQGDLRLVPKVRAMYLEDGLLAISFVPTIILPTGGKTPYAGEHGVVIAPSVAASSRLGLIRVAANLGYRYRDRTKIQTLIVDDEVFYKFAGSFDLDLGQGSPIELIGELHGHTPASNGFGLGTSDPIKKEFQKARTALELDIGFRMTLLDSVVVSLGGGGGLQPGYGAPAPRMFASVGYRLGSVVSDVDADGIPDELDKCPEKPEDIDNFQDEDGCPEFDNDGDKVLDEDDQCPNEKEDKDGFNDEDGCPDPDNDEDGLLDGDDSCPAEAEDIDNFEDTDGCPDIDNDGDEVADAVDKCPDEAEDKDGFLDFDGCPDPDNDGDGLPDLNDLCPNHAEDMDGVADDDGCPEDNDGDGIADADDKCPNKAETYNGIKDEDGCPEKLRAKSLVRVTEDKIEIKEKVFFKSGSAKMLKKSNNLLNQVAAVLKNYKHITKIRIEGHTDSRGNKRRNRRLSQQRADAVKAYLVKQGVDEARLDTEGLGPDRPVASNKSKRGREQNRRVEFVIVEQKPIGEDVAANQPEPEAEIDLNLDMEVPAGDEAAPDAAPAEEPMFEIGGDDEAAPEEELLFEIGGDDEAEPAPEESKPADPPAEDAEDDGGEIEFNF